MPDAEIVKMWLHFSTGRRNTLASASGLRSYDKTRPTTASSVTEDDTCTNLSRAAYVEAVQLGYSAVRAMIQ